jgi:hypothetical protein
VVKDPDTGYFRYATLSGDENQLVPTGPGVDDVDPQSPIPTSEDADLDCSSADVSARFAVVGDFDGNGVQDQLAICIEGDNSARNDFWVMKFGRADRRLGHRDYAE